MLFNIVFLICWNIKPNIKRSFFILLEALSKIPLNISNNSSSSFKVPFIPIFILHVFDLLALVSK